MLDPERQEAKAFLSKLQPSPMAGLQVQVYVAPNYSFPQIYSLYPVYSIQIRTYHEA